MDPHGKPSQNGGGSFWSGGYGYDQSGQGGGGGGRVVGSSVIKGTGASEPVQPPTRPPTAPSTQTEPGTGVGPAGGEDNFPGAGSAVTPVDELSSSPGSLKVILKMFNSIEERTFIRSINFEFVIFPTKVHLLPRQLSISDNWSTLF